MSSTGLETKEGLDCYSFISFKKGHTSGIRPAILSYWLKKLSLCYKQADQQYLDLVQVKAHDIRTCSDNDNNMYLVH